jgi:hypothetical protein
MKAKRFIVSWAAATLLALLSPLLRSEEARVKAAKPVPPEEWAQFEAETKAAASSEHPKIEEIQRIQKKWFSKWGIQDQIQKINEETSALKKKYGAYSSPSIAEFTHDPRIFDGRGWDCTFDKDASGQWVATFTLNAERYSKYNPQKVDVVLRSGMLGLAVPSEQPKAYSTRLSLSPEQIGEHRYRVSFSMPQEQRRGLVIEIFRVMEPRWIAYGCFAIPEN